MKLLQIVLACAFVGWCLYAGVYVPAQYGAYGSYGTAPRHDEAVPDPATSVEDDGEGVGENDVGVDLDDEDDGT